MLTLFFAIECESLFTIDLFPEAGNGAGAQQCKYQVDNASRTDDSTLLPEKAENAGDKLDVIAVDDHNGKDEGKQGEQGIEDSRCRTHQM